MHTSKVDLFNSFISTLYSWFIFVFYVETHTKPSLKCDFEDPNLCGWTHDLNHDFEWSREQLSTPSGAIGTGPSHDHTLGEGKEGELFPLLSASKY